jgi:hypothetical protein
MKRYMALGAVITALGVGGTALGEKAAAGGAAAQAIGGLAMTPTLIEHSAQPGVLTSTLVANRSSAPLAVTVAARPWKQAVTGKVSLKRNATLPGITIDKTSFTLAPGAEQVVTATLASAPAAGYQYGGLEVVGVPTDAATRKGVVLGYRLISSLRILPAAPKVALTLGTPKATKGTAVVPVKNAGNTLDPVSGSVDVKSPTGTKRYSFAGTRVLPGSSVNLPAGSKLAKGSYSAKVTLTQRGKKVLTTTKTFKVK